MKKSSTVKSIMQESVIVMTITRGSSKGEQQQNSTSASDATNLESTKHTWNLIQDVHAGPETMHD